LGPNGKRGERARPVPRFASWELTFFNKDAEKAGTGDLLVIEDHPTTMRKSSFYKRRAVWLAIMFLLLTTALVSYSMFDLGKGLTGTEDYIVVETLLLPGIFSLLFAYVYFRMSFRDYPIHFYGRGVVIFGSKRGTPGFFEWTFWKHYRWMHYGSLGKVLVVGNRPNALSLIIDLDDLFHITVLPSMEGFDEVLRTVKRDLKEWGG